MDDFPLGARVQVGNWTRDSRYTSQVASYVNGQVGTVVGKNPVCVKVFMDVPNDVLLSWPETQTSGATRSLLVVYPEFLRRVDDDNTPLLEE